MILKEFTCNQSEWNKCKKEQAWIFRSVDSGHQQYIDVWVRVFCIETKDV